MFHWVPVLDRFDSILERICNDFHLQQQVQSREFDSNTKALLLAITSILKVLFEHCTNRNIYNSFEVGQIVLYDIVCMSHISLHIVAYQCFAEYDGYRCT